MCNIFDILQVWSYNLITKYIYHGKGVFSILLLVPGFSQRIMDSLLSISPFVLRKLLMGFSKIFHGVGFIKAPKTVKSIFFNERQIFSEIRVKMSKRVYF